MTFTHDGANNAEIIKSVSYFKDTYSIEYFNGDTSTYYCNNIEELKRLKKIILLLYTICNKNASIYI